MFLNRIFCVLFMSVCFLNSGLFSQENTDNREQLNMYKYAGKLIPKAFLKKTSVNFDDVPAELALNEMKTEHGIELSYNRTTTPLSSPVKLNMENVYVFEVLLEIVKNTGMSLQITKSGNVVLHANQSQEKESSYKGEITGKVTDAATGEPLPGANVIIEGTSLGAATNSEGNYRIRRVPPGRYNLEVSYIGYEVQKVEAQVEAGEKLKQDIALSFAAIKGDEVTVTAQLEGQLAAINQQVSSNTIVNVVSKERIRELPDDNAAESVGRLPGIAVSRSGGEGSRVNIRGMSPKFNSITVDGERIPSTGQGRQLFEFKGAGGGEFSSLTEDRSVDLSVISSEALSGIEVYKALIPEQDADAIGGTVNFVTGKAGAGLQPRLNIIGGYTGYHDSFENVKINGTVSERFFNNALGVLATGSFQRADRSSDSQDINYNLRGEGIQLRNVNLDDTEERRDRYSANLNLDYELGDHSELRLTNFFSRTDREVVNRQYHLDFGQNDGDYAASWSKPNIYVISSNLNSEHSLPFANLDWGVSFIETVDENDFNFGYSFQEPGVFQSLDFVEEEGPYAASNNTNFRPEIAWGGTPWGGGTTRREDQNLSLKLNLERSFSLSSALSAEIKFGGKYRVKERTLEQTSLKSRGAVFVTRFTTDNPDAVLFNNRLAMSNFLGAFDPGDFFYGDHYFPITLDHKRPHEMFQRYRDIWRRPIIDEGLDNYSAKERISAGYFQTEFNWNQRISLLAGARYEYEDNDYSGVFHTDISEQYEDELPSDVIGTKRDTSGTRQIGKWFPQFHLKLGLIRDNLSSKGLDLRLAYTRSITRPEFLLVTPRVHQSNNKLTLQRGRPDLQPTTSWNTDVFLTAYSKLGLLTIGYFYKDLTNVIFESLHKKRPTDIVPGYNASVYDAWFLLEPRNSNADNTVRGWEFELQTNFSWLPNPFDGIVLYGNLSLIDSEVHYPWSITKVETVPPFRTTIIDSSRVESLPGQADRIVNLSLGYDKGGFSGRLSYFFQGETIQLLTNSPLIDGFSDSYQRLDFSASYKITRDLTAIFNVNNILNQRDATFFGVDKLLGGEDIFGTRSEFGLRYEIR